jgi:hypothetical protein
MDVADIIGAVGVTLILIGFVLNLGGRLGHDDVPYLGLNLVGAAMACASSVLIGFVPFVVLEGVWAAAAAFGLARWATRGGGTRV